MKKLFQLAAVAMVALLGMTSCEVKQPTAVMPENMNSKITVCGFVKWSALTSTGTYTTPAFVDDGTKVEVLYGVEEEGKIHYTRYETKVIDNGYYSIQLGAPAGQSVAEVKVEVRLNSERDGLNTYGQTKTGFAMVEADFFGSASETNLYAGNTYKLNVTVMPYVCTSDPDVVFKQ